MRECEPAYEDLTLKIKTKKQIRSEIENKVMKIETISRFVVDKIGNIFELAQ
jgi:hypothetical protein